MSNVLIGIIGVILFIGLALAGALFLGPRFQESTNNSKASASVQVVSQIAQAASMFEVSNGRLPNEGTVDATSEIVTGGFLKAAPSNPTSVVGASHAIVYSTQGGGSLRARYVTMMLGGNSEAICKAVSRQVGQIDASNNPSPSFDGRPVGCYTNGTGSDTTYTVFARV